LRPPHALLDSRESLELKPVHMAPMSTLCHGDDELLHARAASASADRRSLVHEHRTRPQPGLIEPDRVHNAFDTLSIGIVNT